MSTFFQFRMSIAQRFPDLAEQDWRVDTYEESGRVVGARITHMPTGKLLGEWQRENGPTPPKEQ